MHQKKINKTKQKQKKNRKNPKKTNKWAQRRSEFLMHRNEWIKVVQVLSMIWCFYFINTEIFFLSYQHISNIGIERMWECVVRSIRDTNDSISQCKSLYKWNSLFCSRLDCSCLSRPIQVGINFWNFQPLVRSVPISWPWATYFSFQPSYSVNKYILYYFGSIVGWSVLFVVVKSCIPFRSKPILISPIAAHDFSSLIND